jgi:hypothetical protein
VTPADVFAEIAAERVSQRMKWAEPHAWGEGDCSSDQVPVTVKLAVLAEEFGEVARAVLDCKPDDLHRELVQVAAVAVAWLEGMGDDD